MAPKSSKSSNVGEGALAAMHTRLNDLAERLDELSRDKSHAAAPAPSAERDLASALRALETRLDTISAPTSVPALEITTALSRLDQRLENLLDRASDQDGEERVAKVDRILARLNPTPADTDATPPAAASPNGWSGSLDEAIAAITARQRELDAGDPPASTPVAAVPPARAAAAAGNGGPDLSGLQEHLAKLTQELQTLRRPGGFTAAIEALRGELSEIRQTLTGAAPREAMENLRAEVAALSGRVDDIRRSGHDSERLDAIEQSIASLRAILEALAPAESLAEFREEVRALDRKLDRIAAEHDGDGLQSLERQVAELRDIAAHAATGEAMVALAEEVQRIGERLDASTPADSQQFMAALDDRLRELTAEIGRSIPAGDGAPQRASDEIAAMVGLLGEKLDRVDLGASPVLDAMAAQLARLTERIEASDARLGNLDTLERGLAALLDELENLRTSAIATAQRAAQDAVGEFARNSAVAPIEFDTIKQEIDGLRHLQAQSDRRTQDTLEAVHDTLARLVDRVAVLDTAGAPTTPSPGIAPSATPKPEYEQELVAAERSTTSLARALSAHERRPIDPSLPADHPLEPGSAARARPSAAERIAASEAALGAAGAKPSNNDARTNFIAAARRAAQAAANVSAGVPETRDEEPKARRSLGNVARNLTRRRPLMLGLAILVLAGTLHLVLNVINPNDAGPAKSRPTTGEVARTKINVAKAPAATGASPFTTPQPKVTSTEPPSAASSTADPAQPERAPPPAAALVAPPAETDAPAVAAVSPLTIASIKMPAASDVTGSIGRSTGVTRTPSLAEPALNAIPASFGPGLKSAAASGNAAAAHEIGARYAEGRGTAVNLEEAARWFERAAAQGLAPAQYRLGSMYEKGQGVRKDVEQARRLYRAAADQGNGKAMHNLAVLHAEGIDGKPDFAAAAQWFRKAADRGVADSQYNLGILYARGLGVDQNLAESYKWFSLAAQQSDADAARKREDVAARLDASALAAAKAAAEAFRPEPQPEQAITVAAPAGGWDAPAATPAARAKADHPRRILAQ